MDHLPGCRTDGGATSLDCHGIMTLASAAADAPLRV